jgi:hypothetical protein
MQSPARNWTDQGLFESGLKRNGMADGLFDLIKAVGKFAKFDQLAVLDP